VSKFKLGLRPGDVPPPLGEFHATVAEKEETRRLVHTLNKGLGSPVSEPHLNGTFIALWPRLEAELSSMPKPDAAVPQRRSVEDMVAEILDISRAESRYRQGDLLGEQLELNRRAFYGEALGEVRKARLAEMALAGEVPEEFKAKKAGEKMSTEELVKKYIKK